MISQSDLLPSTKPSRTLCSDLAMGIHAAAQPLAVLQASLSKEHTDRMTDGELRELAASSAVEVQRVCTYFSCLQQLLLAEVEPLLLPAPILPLLADAVDGVRLLFQSDGISLVAHLPDSELIARVHRGKTLEALTRVLLVAHALSEKNDTVEVIVSVTVDAAHVTVRSTNASARTINAELSLSVAIAAANLRGQHVDFYHSLRPFEAHITFGQSWNAKEL